MSFLSPHMLLGLIALAIPIIIHLFNFRKSKKVYFSNNALLKNIKEAKSSKLNLKHWLVLAARLLFLTFLVLAFAQPFLPSQKASLEGKDVVIYLDNSLSMTNESEEGLSALDHAVDYTNQILDLYPKGTMFKLLTNEYISSYHFSSKDEVNERLRELQPSAVSRSIPEILNRIAFDIKARPTNRHDIYLVSDFQKSTAVDPNEWELNKNNQYYILPMEYKTVSNVFVDSVYLENPFLIAQENNTVQVIMRNTGDADINDLILKLYVNEAQVSNASVSIGAGKEEVISFELTTELPAYSRCRISFQEFPVAFDNDFYFDLHAAEKVKVLEIRGESYSSNIIKAFGNTQLYQVQSYQAENLDYNQLSKADLVILNEIEQLDETLLPELKAYIENDGYMLVIPSDKAEADSYQQLLPLAIQPQPKQESKLTLAPLDQKNPFFKDIFEEQDKTFEMPTASRFWQMRGAVQPLLRYKDENVFLGRHSEQAQLFFLSTPLEDEYTNFHKHALFIPVMYRIAALSKRYTKALYYTVSEPAILLNVEERAGEEVYKLSRAGQELIPSQRVSQKGLLLEIPKDVVNPGFYDLSLQEEVKGVLSFNHDKRESFLAQYEADELEEQFEQANQVEIFKGKSSDHFTKEMKNKHFGVELWKYALALALFFLLFEVLLIRFL